MDIFYKIFRAATASKMGRTPTKPGRSPDIFAKVGRDFLAISSVLHHKL